MTNQKLILTAQVKVPKTCATSGRVVYPGGPAGPGLTNRVSSCSLDDQRTSSHATKCGLSWNGLEPRGFSQNGLSRNGLSQRGTDSSMPCALGPSAWSLPALIFVVFNEDLGIKILKDLGINVLRWRLWGWNSSTPSKVDWPSPYRSHQVTSPCHDTLCLNDAGDVGVTRHLRSSGRLGAV